MQQLLQDMRDMEQALLPLCENMMAWKAEHLYEDFQEIAQPMTTMVSLLLNNKQLFLEYGISVEETVILERLEKIAAALEQKDEICLLDAVYQGYLPWLQRIREQIEALLEGQEG